MPIPTVKRVDDKNIYVVRMSVGEAKIRCTIPDAELAAAPHAGKNRAALQKAKALAKSFHDSIPEE
jgi:hypothetical protein